jgi:hypothetical protein
MIEKLFIDEKDIEQFKEGIEDLSLYLQEIENICLKLEDDSISEDEKNSLLYKLKVLENYAKSMNDKVKDIIIDNNNT